jgi:hypothetical protein
MNDEQNVVQFLREAASEDVAKAYRILHSHLSALDEDDLFGNALATVLDYAADRQEQQMRAAATRIAALLEALEGMTRAADGLSHGVDWNNGTHAKTHGYRQKLLDALPAARAAIAAAKGSRDAG